MLIINCTTLQPPRNGWGQKTPPTNDPSVAANVLLGRNWRNCLFHELDAYSIDEALFDVKWDEGVAIVQGLGGDISEMETLKTTSLDPKQEMIIFSLMEFNQIKLDKLRRRFCVLEATTNGVDSQAQQTAGKVQQIDGEVQQLTGEVLQIDGEIHQIQQRLDQENEAIHNKFEKQAQHITGEMKELKKNLADHNSMLNQLKEISIYMETLRNKNQENFIPSNRIGSKSI